MNYYEKTINILEILTSLLLLLIMTKILLLLCLF